MNEILNSIKKLPQEKANEIYRQIAKYVLNEEEPKELDCIDSLIWKLIKYALDNTY